MQVDLASLRHRSRCYSFLLLQGGVPVRHLNFGLLSHTHQCLWQTQAVSASERPLGSSLWLLFKFSWQSNFSNLSESFLSFYQFIFIIFMVQQMIAMKQYAQMITVIFSVTAIWITDLLLSGGRYFLFVLIRYDKESLLNSLICSLHRK